MIQTDDFEFELPEELIAKHPVEKRDESRLLVVDRKTNSFEATKFNKIGNYLKPGDLLVLNNTKVISARLPGKKKNGTSFYEFLLYNQLDDYRWEAISSRLKRIKEGETFYFKKNVKAIIEQKIENGSVRLKFDNKMDNRLIDEIGIIPLPPYIAKRRAVEESDYQRYQTIYSEVPGSIASPTAGLHFTQELIDSLEQNGIEIVYITLHVSLGTFKPIKTDVIENHIMDREYFIIDESTASKVNETKERGSKVFGVGTTVIRTLESSFKNGKVRPSNGSTDLFIYPGYNFNVIDCFITNFHVPKSTPYVLVCSFSNLDLIKKAYQYAIDKKYRFYSYGDSMLIL